jgi:hypothetical protein
VARFGILIGFIIPIINVLAVSTLIWYSGQAIDIRERLRITLRALVSNPLILGCLAGMAYSRTIVGEFPRFPGQHLSPGRHGRAALALLSIGGTLTLKNLKNHLGHAFLGPFIKLMVLPVVGWFLPHSLDASPLSFQVGMLFFSLPTSPAIIVLSSQLNSDTEFASRGHRPVHAVVFLLHERGAVDFLTKEAKCRPRSTGNRHSNWSSNTTVRASTAGSGRKKTARFRKPSKRPGVMTREKVTVIGSGRTDAGVHALAQTGRL